jgi:winged helix DNA-binding protein
MPDATLTPRALNRALLARQMLLAREKISSVAAIERLAGMQAQQPQPPVIGLWTRLEGFRREDLLRRLADRGVVRATLMRATLHLWSARDYLALRASLQPALSLAMRSILRDRLDGLNTEAMLAAARKCFEEQPRTFTELREALIKAFPKEDERAMGYLVRTHLPLVVVPGEAVWGYGADAPFAAAEAWLGKPLKASQSPQALVLRYLAAFGPATAADAQTWSSLPKLQEVFEALRPKLRVFRDARRRELFDLPDAPRPPEDAPAPVRFLPGFDNLVLSHADRTRIISDEHRPRVVTRNLQVLPSFLVDGFVAGTWTASRRKQAATLTISPFARLPAAAKSELAEEAERLARFLHPDVSQFEITWSN